MDAVPARLHILLAREAPIGLIIRRGPSKHVCTIGWNRTKDTFEIGQWLYGRIYERRCDLSPDGKHFIYFAMNGQWESEVKGAWSAISHTPFLKAIGLWAKGDCWNGGGLFFDNKTFWLNDERSHKQLKAPRFLKSVATCQWVGHYGGECPGLYYPRLQRDGWTISKTHPLAESPDIDVFEKRFGKSWTLRKFAHATIDHPVGRGCYFDEHELENTATGQRIDCRTWEWADIDSKRLVYAEAGRLIACEWNNRVLSEPVVLHDFNAMEFSRRTAPY